MGKRNDYSARIVCNFLATKSVFNATWQHVQLREEKKPLHYKSEMIHAMHEYNESATRSMTF